MNLLESIITYVRRIVKTPSNTALSDNIITDYINRFWLMDMDARLQLFDLKTKFQFQTIPGVASYNLPLYTAQSSSLQSTITPFPAYQGIFGPAYANGIQCPFYVQREDFYRIWPNYIQALTPVATGDGFTTTFQINLPFFPAIPGHIDITGVIASNTADDVVLAGGPFFTDTLIPVPGTSLNPGIFIVYTNANGSITTVVDSGQFLDSGTNEELYGLLVEQVGPGESISALGAYSTTSNTVNYNTEVVNVTLPSAPGQDVPIQAQCYFYQQGIPRAILYYDNDITIRPPPDISYLIELDAYLTPAAFLSTSQAIPFAYMAEYVARGAARKILSDTGDWEQFQAYEPLFIEQERNVWKRSQRIFTSTRTGTIFSDLQGPQSQLSNIGQGAT